MNIDIRLNGANTAQGFVIAGGRATDLVVKTTDSRSRPIQLRVTGGSIALNPSTFEASPEPVHVQLECPAPSNVLNDHSIEVIADGEAVAEFAFTVIQSPRIQFEGRFQCRLSTDPDGFEHLWGENSSFGMYAVQGPNPDNPIEPPLDRVIRFHEPVALRKHAPPVGVFVRRVDGVLSDGLRVTFESGDAVIGQPVSLGPQCKFDARDGAFAQPGFEPISDFQFKIGTMFNGASDPALPRPDSSAPPPNNAPYADGFFRMDQMSTLKPTDFGYPDQSWTTRAERIFSEKVAQLEAETSVGQEEQILRDRRLQEHRNNRGGILFSIRMLERYSGQIDRNIDIDAEGSPSLQTFQSSPTHPWYAEFFDFDTDLHCGTVWGTLG